MRIILINLARASGRLKKMRAQFESLGVFFEVLEATDGQGLTDEQRSLVDQEARRKITAYPMSDNEIGCCISHSRAIEMIRDGNMRMGAIIEDDAYLTQDFPRVLQAIEMLDIPFDIIDLHRKHIKKKIFVPCVPLLPGFSLGRIRHMHMGAIGYIVSHEGAIKILNIMPPFIHGLDKEIHRTWAHDIDLYALESPVVIHSKNGKSYIDETRGRFHPKERVRYPRSNALYWRLQRFLSKSRDSIQKRLAFPAYVRLAKKNAN